MLTIKTFVFNMVEENTYVAHDETGEGVLIDCGALYAEEQEELASYVEKEGIALRHLLCTHGHFDHVFGNAYVQHKWGLRPVMHHDDLAIYNASAQMVERLMHTSVDVGITPVESFLKEGDRIALGSHSLSVIHTPGHSPGGVCLYCEVEGVLFSGDSLFRHEIGRTDLQGGDFNALVGGIRSKLFSLPGSTVVYPGHGPSTTIADEIAHNPYFPPI